MSQIKAMTVRLSAEQAAAVEMVAAVDDTPVSEVIRAAVTEHVARRRQEPDFQAGLREQIQRAQRLLAD